MRVTDQALPGDLVIRPREDRSDIHVRDEWVIASNFRPPVVWIITTWPDAELVTAGPYQSYAYAFEQAKRIAERSVVGVRIWRDHAKGGQAEELEDVTT